MNTQFNVMVIDDHPLQTTILTQILDRYCAQVIPFSCVDAAIQSVQEQYFDVIFCDIQMPGKDGIDMMEMLDKVQYQGQVVLVSAMELTIISAVRAMCEGFSFEVLGKLPKPYDENEVVDLLGKIKDEKAKQVSFAQPIEVEDQEFLFALAEGHVKNYYQPLVDVQSGEVLGYEALARWNHPIYGVLPPHYFLPIVERCRLSGELFQAVLSNVIYDMKHRGLTQNVSINVDHENLEDTAFSHYFLQQCSESEIDPSQITIEITERDTFQTSASLYKNLLKLRMNGVTVSIDDFGTGSSTFEKLAQLPFNELKIDRSFVQGVECDIKKRNIVVAICALAKSLNIRLVAEGIEDEVTLQAIREYGIDLCQGFYIDKPMPLEAITILNERYE
ncbi:EAL domain-containing response regulator [Vibrio alginolyticus]|uniref:EAL domain-containing response regulator n=1 Tax=Vibrio alginolyticus TaxID=663 RepID=UPI001EEA2B33|nr:EAL domain-containing response regulator [Vibrio alginolyticus]EIO9261324.1 EAL domain-containing response regulator [Vibrio alginolyticus]ELB2873113.1 EAL domain-containing response regulator [Vibrio alginolyticus]ELB2944497.1 EAL domain-containing response regulator [Vibrio alginolyticus]MCG6331418.1 EAL domain-containing protein [Vibrio alginolyticus]MCG6337306.1 EAL domain-containing protein [Vibrio alginolyticus]